MGLRVWLKVFILISSVLFVSLVLISELMLVRL